MRKRGVGKVALLVSSLLMGMPLIRADSDAGIGAVGSYLQDVLKVLSTIFNFGWIGADAALKLGLLKFMLWLTIFTIIFMGGSQVPILNRRFAGILAAIFATATIILIPTDLVMSVWLSYTIIIVLILIAIPVGGMMYYIYGVLPNNITNRRSLAIIRFFVLLLAWVVTVKMLDSAAGLTKDSFILLLAYIPKNNIAFKTKKKEKLC